MWTLPLSLSLSPPSTALIVCFFFFSSSLWYEDIKRHSDSPGCTKVWMWWVWAPAAPARALFWAWTTTTDPRGSGRRRGSYPAWEDSSVRSGDPCWPGGSGADPATVSPHPNMNSLIARGNKTTAGHSTVSRLGVDNWIVQELTRGCRRSQPCAYALTGYSLSACGVGAKWEPCQPLLLVSGAPPPLLESPVT